MHALICSRKKWFGQGGGFINTVSPLTTNEFCSESAFKSSLFVSPTKLRSPTNTTSYIALYCNWFITLFTQMICKKQRKSKENIFSLTHCGALRTVVPATSLLLLGLLLDVLGLK